MYVCVFSPFQFLVGKHKPKLAGLTPNIAIGGFLECLITNLESGEEPSCWSAGNIF